MTPDQFKTRQSFAGLSNKELSEALGYSERHVRNLRNGNTEINKRTAMAMEKLTPDYKEK